GGWLFLGVLPCGGCALQMHPALQVLEADDLAVVQRDDLSIDDEGLTRFRRQVLQCRRDLRKLTGLVEAVARDERDAAARDEGENANAIVLRLVYPGTGSGLVGSSAREHREERLQINGALLRPGLLRLRSPSLRS